MRTVVFVLVMLLVAVAAGLSFVLRAGAEPATPAASAPTTAQLDFQCGAVDAPRVLQSGVPTLVSCTAAVTNTGGQSFSGASIMFEPSSAGLGPPDRYCFFSATHDGVDLPVGCGDLSYSFGDIEPGARSVINLRVIVATTHEYGADVVLRDGSGREYARTTVHGLVGEPPASGLAVKFVPRYADSNGYSGTEAASYALYAINLSNEHPYDDVTVELAVASPGGSTTLVESAEWTATAASGHLVSDLGPLAPQAEIERMMTFALTPAYAGVCNYLNPVIVVSAKRGDVTDTAVAMSDAVTVGACDAQSGADAPGELPAAGMGDARGTRAARIAFIALAAGVMAMAAGLARKNARARRRSRV